MEIFEAIVGAFTILGSLAAAFVAIYAFKAYQDLSPASQLRRRQNEYMLKVSTVTQQSLELILTFAVASQNQMDPRHLYLNFQNLCKQLNKLLEEANLIGLGHIIVGEHKDRWSYFTAFRGALNDCANLDPDAITIHDVLKEHINNGLMRLADCCIAYELEEPTRGLSKKATLSIHDNFEQIKQDIDITIHNSAFASLYKQQAWSYLNESEK